MLDGNSFNWLLPILLPRIDRGWYYDIFNNYVELKGVSSNAVFPCMLCYDIYLALCEMDLFTKRRRGPNLQGGQLGIVTEYA